MKYREITTTELVPDVVVRALLNRKQAASYLGVSPWTVDRLVALKKLRPIRLTDKGNSPWMFRVRDLNAFIERRQRARVPKPPVTGAAKKRQEQVRAARQRQEAAR